MEARWLDEEEGERGDGEASNGQRQADDADDAECQLVLLGKSRLAVHVLKNNNK